MNQDIPTYPCNPPQPFQPPTRTIKFTSEFSLVCFIRELPGKVAFEVVEQDRRGHYLFAFL